MAITIEKQTLAIPKATPEIFEEIMKGVSLRLCSDVL